MRLIIARLRAHVRIEHSIGRQIRDEYAYVNAPIFTKTGSFTRIFPRRNTAQKLAQ